jgi:uncharacterized membrane protein
MAVDLEALGLEEVVDLVVAVAVLAVEEHQEDGNMNITRLCKHLLHFPWLVHYKFPPSSLNKIEEAITLSEKNHSAEIRFAIESSLSFFELLQNTPCFDRGVDIFSELRIWDTEENNGVLIFLLLADKKVEIVADRGLNKKISKDDWLAICNLMEQAFKQNKFETGVITGINKITKKLVQHYPLKGQKSIDELPNKPVIL